MSNKFYKEDIDSGYRIIQDGSRYDHLFPQPLNRDRVIIENGSVEDTIKLMKKVVWKYIADTRKIASLLRQPRLIDTCEQIWSFLYHNIQYKLDKAGLEQIRRPARSMYEKITGIDCDCFSVFVSSILTNLQIPHKFRVTKYEKDVFQHVYVVVPIGNENYIIDPVLSIANYEKPYKQKIDFDMTLKGINIAVLDGASNEEDHIKDIIEGKFDGLGKLKNDEATYNYLVKTRNNIAANPLSVASVEDPVSFLQMLDYAIKYWNTPQREKALEVLIQNEDSLNIKNGFNPDEISGIDDPEYEDGLENDWSSIDGLSNAEIDEYLDTLEEGHDLYDEELDNIAGLGMLGKGGREKRQAKRAERKKLREEKKAIKQQNKGKARKEAMKDFRKTNKRGFFRAIGKGIKKVVRFDPVAIAARNGFLLAMKLNMFKMAERLKWAYATPEQIKGKISDDYYQKAKRLLVRVEKLFADKLQGKKDKLRNAILNGKSGGLHGIPDQYFNQSLYGLGDGGISASVLLTAASSVIAAVVSMFKKEGMNDKDDPESNDIEQKLKSAKPNVKLVKSFIADLTKKSGNEIADNNYQEMDLNEQENDGYTEDNPSTGNKLVTFIKNNPMVAVGGAAGLIGLGWLIFKPKKEVKPEEKLAGTEDEKTDKQAGEKIKTIKLK